MVVVRRSFISPTRATSTSGEPRRAITSAGVTSTASLATTQKDAFRSFAYALKVLRRARPE